MATFTSAQAIFGLSAIGAATSTNASGSVTIGVPQTRIALESANVAYSIGALLVNSSDLIIDAAQATTSSTGTWVAGTAQVETATAAGTIGTAGNATVVVTSSFLPTQTISVAVASGDTASVWAGKVRTALAADVDIAAAYSVSGTGASIVLTVLPTDTVNGTPIYPSNDVNINVSLANGTCTGITTAATSANTTAGVITSGTYILDGDGKDFEGVDIPTMASTQGVLVYCESGTVEVVGSSQKYLSMGVLRTGSYGLKATTGGLIDSFPDATLTITSTTTSYVTVTLLAIAS